MGNELPLYKCHKKVKAFKIDEITFDSDSENRAMLKGYCLVKVDHNYLKKHNPQVGGYYVRYADGYESFSPAEAFESGYSLIK